MTTDVTTLESMPDVGRVSEQSGDDARVRAHHPDLTHGAVMQVGAEYEPGSEK